MSSIEEGLEKGRKAGKRYTEFLRVSTMSAGVYALPVGGVDTQQPHSEDEVYYVVRGRGRFQHGGVEQAAEPGDLLFVPAKEPHHFHSITEELVLLVVFAPPERDG
ncbi:MAG TPA: cupin domain-containing protein [Thermoplasmata archaeon]|nr:cupin domain-containing protein [Thermoplasmata archaeon]